MKRIIATSFAISTSCLVSANAEIESEIPIGLEAVTGIRSEYVHRGFKLSQQVADFQLEGEVTVGEGKYLGYGAWYATGTGSNSFTEAGFKLSYTQDFDTWQYYAAAIYRNYSNTTFESGMEFTNRVSYYFSESEQHSHQANFIASYDTGAEGFYAALEYENYTAINEDSYLSFRSGVSYVSDFYTRDGANDAYARLSYTYNLTSQVSITPYAGASLQLDDANGQDHAYAGLWFEVSF